MLGIDAPDVEEALDEADRAVYAVVRGTDRVEDAAQDVERFQEQVEGILSKLRERKPTP
jgi:ABC-type transporter Mla subunit MlaD